MTRKSIVAIAAGGMACILGLALWRQPVKREDPVPPAIGHPPRERGEDRKSAAKAEEDFLLAMKTPRADYVKAFLEWAKVAGEDDPNFRKYADWVFGQFSKDAGKAYDFAERLPFEKSRDGYRFEAVTQAARQDPALATTLLDRMPQGRIRSSALERVLAAAPPEVAARWLTTSGSPADMVVALGNSTLASQLAAGSGKAILEKLKGGNLPVADETRAISSLLSGSSPEQRAALARELFATAGNTPELDRIAFHSLAAGDIRAAVQLLNEKNDGPNPPDKEEMLKFIAMAGEQVSKGDRMKELEWLSQLDGSLKEQALERFIAETPEMNDEYRAALKSAGMSDEWIAKREAWQRTIGHRAEDLDAKAGAIRQAAEEAAKAYSPSTADRGYSTLSRQLAILATPEEREAAVARWITDFASASPAEAATAIEQHPELQTNPQAYESVIRGLAGKSNKDAVEWAMGVSNPARQQEAVRYATRQWLTENEQAASEGILNLKPSPAKDYAVRSMAEWSVQRSNPEEARQWLARIRNDGIRSRAEKELQLTPPGGN